MIGPSSADRAAAVLADVLRRVPGYVPEAASPPPAGPVHAMLRVLARFRYLLDRGLEDVPNRALVAWLDALGLRLAPASAARVPLVFTLAPDARLDVTVPAGSQVAAPPVVEPPAIEAPAQPPAAAEPIVFATERTVTLTRSRLVAMHSIEPGADRFADHTGDVGRRFTLFGDLTPTEHALYLGHDTLFAFGGDITLLVGVALERGAATPLDLRWEYASEAGWIPLQNAREDDTTGGFVGSGQLALRRACGPDAKKTTFGGRTSFWLRAAMRSPVLPGTSALPLVINDVNVRVRFSKTGLAPDAAYADFVELDTSKDFYPFGPRPTTHTTFYLTSKEVFQRGGARVTLRFKLSEPGTQQGVVLAWEYSTADGWLPLSIDPPPGAPGAVSPSAVDFSKDATVAFTCPQDWTERDVNGASERWLRVRLVKGHYGVAGTNLDAPVVETATLGFEYLTDPEPVQHCLAQNDFVFADHSEACRWPDLSFSPFHAVADRAPAVHMGFDRPLPVGLVSLFVDVAANETTTPPVSPFVWEYRAANGWSELSVLDETHGFRRRGMLQFVGPPDAVAVDGLGGLLYRVRARLKQGEAMESAAISGMWVNAIWAAHYRRVDRELLGRSDGTPGQTLRFTRAPVLEGETIEVNEWTGRGDTWHAVLDGVPENDLRFERDAAAGVVTAVWVRWHERPHLHDSSPADRHYAIERATGRLRFGPGVPAAGKRIVATYATGGGAAGNVAAGSVRELRVALPFIAAVDNPIAAQGGADIEAGIVERGPQRVRHRDRALSASDYEWLARDASPEVARARCEPITAPDGKARRGWVTLSIAGRSREPRVTASDELAERVRAYVAARAPASTSVRIRTADAVAVSVRATIAPDKPGEAALVERRVREALNHFLHPIAGGPAGTGWTFGEPVYLSQVAAVIERTPGVDYAESVVLLRDDVVCDGVVPVPRNSLVAPGSHELTLRIGRR